MLLPHPAVIVPRREKARFTIGDEGTLLGLNTWKPVSHRNRGAAPQGTELRFDGQFTEAEAEERVRDRKVVVKVEVGDISSTKLNVKRERRRKQRKRALRIFVCCSTCGGSNYSMRTTVE
jgi:hypothetical protein